MRTGHLEIEDLAHGALHGLHMTPARELLGRGIDEFNLSACVRDDYRLGAGLQNGSQPRAVPSNLRSILCL
jgi:hypothetical protein